MTVTNMFVDLKYVNSVKTEVNLIFLLGHKLRVGAMNNSFL